MRPLHVSRVGNFDPEDEIKLRAIERLANESPGKHNIWKASRKKRSISIMFNSVVCELHVPISGASAAAATGRCS